MRQIIVSLLFAASVLSLAACSNGSSSTFVPNQTQSTARHAQGYPWG